MPRPEKHVFVCTQSRPEGHPRGACANFDCKAVHEEFMYQWQQRELWGTYKLATSSCIGPCKEGPNVLVYPEGVMYSHVSPQDVATIVEEHIIGNVPVEKLKTDPEFW